MKPSQNRYQSQLGAYGKSGHSPLRQKSKEPPNPNGQRPLRVPMPATRNTLESKSKQDLRKAILQKEKELAMMIKSANDVALRVHTKKSSKSLKKLDSIALPKGVRRQEDQFIREASRIISQTKGTRKSSKRSSGRAERKNKSSSKQSSFKIMPVLREVSSSQSKFTSLNANKERSPLRFLQHRQFDASKSAAALPIIDSNYQTAPISRQFETINQNFTGNNSPLRVRSNSRSKSPAVTDQRIIGDEFTVEMPERDTRPDPPEKDSSSLRVKLHPVPVRNSSQEFKSILKNKGHAREESTLDRLNTLNADIIRYRRKIDQVREEIEVVNKQKSDLMKRLTLGNQEQTEYTHRINKHDLNMKFEENSLQQKINFEKRENDKLYERIEQINKHKNDVNSQIHSEINKMVHSDNLAKRIELEINATQQNAALIIQQDQNVVNQIANLDEEVRNMTRHQLELYRELKSLEITREQSASERFRLQADLNEVTSKFNQIKSVTTEDHQQIFRNGDLFCKQIAARIIGNLVQLLVSNQQQNSFDEVKQFSQFDAKCMTGLKYLARLMQKVGHQKQRQGLEIWYENTLKPSDLKYQNQDIFNKAISGGLMGKCFQAWKKYCDKRINQYKVKTEAINKIWAKYNQNMIEEQKRYFAIWREKTLYNEERKLKMKRLITRCYRHNIENSFYSWKFSTTEVMVQARMVLLKREYAHKFYLNVVFQKFKQQIVAAKLEKWRIKHYSFKGWQDFIAYKKFIFHQNLAANKFLMAGTQARLRGCFDALRNNKERRKYKLVSKALQEEMNSEIQDFTSQSQKAIARFKNADKKQAIRTVRDQFGKRLFSYFQTWKNQQRGVDISLNKNVADLIIRTYRQHLRSSFQHWNKQGSLKAKHNKKKMIVQLTEESNQLENESIANESIKKKHAEEVRSMRNKQQSKILRKYIKRVIGSGFNRWRDQLELKNSFQAKQERILKKVRYRLMGQAFQKYKAFLYKERQFDENTRESEELIYKFQLQRLKVSLDNWAFFVGQYIKAKRSLKRIYARKHIHTLRKRIIRWRENAAVKKIYDLKFKQSKGMKAIENRSQKLLENDKQVQEGLRAIEKLNEKMKKKAHKLIGNHFMRYYSNNTQMRFKTWKTLYEKQKHKEKLFKMIVAQQNQAKMNAMRAAFKAFVTQEVQKQKKYAIRTFINECDSEISMINKSEQFIQKERVKAKEKMVRSSNHQAFKKKRLDKAVNIISRRNNDLWFSSYKRKVFEALRDIGKQDRAFVMAVSNVLTKSMTNKGFEYIREASRVNHQNNRKFILIKLMIQRFLKKNIGEYFLLWKDGCRVKVNTHYRETKEAYEETVSFFTNKMKNVKKQNMRNVKHFFDKRWLKRLWDGWIEEKNTRQSLRLASENFKGVNAAIVHRQGLQKWWHRVQLTHRLRFNFKTMKENKQFRIKRAVWDGIWARRAITRQLVQSLSNLENEFADYHKVVGFRTLKSYNNTKKHGAKIKDKISLDNINSILSQRNQIILKRYFSRYRGIVREKNNKAQHCRKIILKMMNANLRWGFDAWRHANRRLIDTQELNETGPVMEQVFEANRAILNLKDFMASERYTKEEIAEWMERVESTNQFQMMKLYKRMKIPKENRIMTRAFDHWVMWYKVKKLFRYHMRYCGDRATPVLCDLRQAFNMWKNNDSHFGQQLSRANIKKLQYKNLKQSDLLTKLANRQAICQANLHYLSDQRNKLIDHSIRAKRNATFLIHENYIKDLRIAMMRWKALRDHSAKYDGDIATKQHNELIVRLKERINNLENENSTLADENEELRKFSLEGFEIANTVKELDSEKNRLQADLDDETATMNELLRQQEDLKNQLRALGALDYLGCNANSKFLNQSFLKNHKHTGGANKMMAGIDRSEKPEHDKENVELSINE